MALHTGADAAPEGVLLRARVIAAGTAHQRRHIGIAARRRILRGHYMVQVRAFVVVEVGRVGRPAVYVARELEHVVGVAVLAGLLGDMSGESVRCGEVFTVRIATDDVAVMLRHRCPEEACAISRRGLAAELMNASKT